MTLVSHICAQLITSLKCALCPHAKQFSNRTLYTLAAIFRSSSILKLYMLAESQRQHAVHIAKEAQIAAAVVSTCSLSNYLSAQVPVVIELKEGGQVSDLGAEGRSKGPCDVFDPWVRLGEGSGWDLRIRPAPAASGNLGMFVGIKIGLKWVHMARYGLIQPPK